MPLAHPAVLLIEGDGGLQFWKKDRGSDDTKMSLTPTLARSSLFSVLCCLVLLAEGVCSPCLLKCMFTVSIPGPCCTTRKWGSLVLDIASTVG